LTRPPRPASAVTPLPLDNNIALFALLDLVADLLTPQTRKPVLMEHGLRKDQSTATPFPLE